MLSTLRKRIETAHDFYEIPRWKLAWFAAKAGKNTDRWYLDIAEEALKGYEFYLCITGTCNIIWEPRTEGYTTLGPDNCACHDALDPRGKFIT